MPAQQALHEYFSKLLFRFQTELQSIARIYNISFGKAKDHRITLVKSTLIKELEVREKSTEV